MRHHQEEEMRWFETRGPVNPQDNYVVPRKPQVKTEQVAGMTIRSYVIPVVQEQPSAVTL